MIIDLNFSFLLCFLCLINSIICDDFKCPERGKVGESKVPNVLSLIDKQTGYHASVEVINPTLKNLIHDYYDWKNKVGWIDLEATIQGKVNRFYYYHSTEEKLAVRENICTRLDLTQDEKIESIKEWFEPTDIVASSEMFKDLIHLGPTGLMIYAHSISDKASFIGTQLIEGRIVNHWFYCTNPNGPYIDFYFDVKTSLPYRFSLYYPEWIETQEAISINETRTVKKQVDSKSKYVYNYYMFEPLVISSEDPIPYPLGYGCALKDTNPYIPLPDFSQVKEFTMDMEAIITYSDRDPIKSTARVMKRGEVISYEIQEGTDFFRFIEMPTSLGRFEVDKHTGRCHYYVVKPEDIYSIHDSDALITRWPLHQDRGFNLLYYLVMKPPIDHEITFIGEIPFGPFRVEEYSIEHFFFDSSTAIVDYYYTKSATNSVPSKVIFTKGQASPKYDHDIPMQIEVTIINSANDNIDYEDGFDVSGCYEEPGNFTWFQLLFSNPWTSNFDMQEIKESTEKYLTSFIPITRIGSIHTQEVDSNIYVTVKLYDRVHFIEAYNDDPQYAILDPSNVVQTFKVEDCEQLCTANSDCYYFSYCGGYECSMCKSLRDTPEKKYKPNCTFYTRYIPMVTSFVYKNYLSTMSHVLQQIRNKVSSGKFRLPIGLSAEDLFVVNGPEDIGDISQQLHTSGSKPLRAEDFPIIKSDRHFNEAQFEIQKSTLQDCFMACLNDPDCNTLSYCIDQDKECILSGETSSSLKDTLEDKTSHADGFNIYQKSFMNQFHEYPGKSLVVDAVLTISDVPIGDCAKRCAQSNDFNCESFDYCQGNYERNESVCFLHVNHIEIDKAHQINATNWKFAEAGCSHYSKKSELDYEHKVGLALKDNMKESIVGTFDHLSLEHCAFHCNTDPNCFTFEFCEKINTQKIAGSSASLTSCSLTNLKPNSASQPQLFEQSKKRNKICSIYINNKKITGKRETEPQPSESPTKSNNFNLTFGLVTIVFVLGLAGGFIGFKVAAFRVISERLIRGKLEMNVQDSGNLS